MASGLRSFDVRPIVLTVSNGDIDPRVAVTGSGPLILCIHGWPELWYSWRHQMEHLAAHGFTVAAMDVRGYGGSSNPPEIEAYRLSELCGDAAAVIDELGDGTAIVFGHDWGAPIAWNTARLHADRVRAVAGLSVPYTPIGPVSSLEMWKQRYEGKFFYQLYIQQPGVAEAECSADDASALRNFVPGLDLFDFAPVFCSDFRGSTIIPDVGHWIQQEAPAATNAALGAFVDSLA